MNITNIEYIDNIIYKHLHKSYLNDVHQQIKSIRLEKIMNYHKNHNSISDGSNEQYENFNNICLNYYIENNCRISLNNIQNLLIQYELQLGDEFYDEIQIIDVYNEFNMKFSEFSKYFSSKYDCDVFDSDYIDSSDFGSEPDDE
jgi:hypothetical protein